VAVSQNAEMSPATSAYIAQINRLNIRVICPPGSTCESLVIETDRRTDVRDLRRRIAKELNLNVSEFRLHRQSTAGQEIKEDAQPLFSSGLYNDSYVAVSLGTPMTPGQFSVLVSLYTASYRPGTWVLEQSPEWEASKSLSATDHGQRATHVSVSQEERAAVRQCLAPLTVSQPSSQLDDALCDLPPPGDDSNLMLDPFFYDLKVGAVLWREASYLNPTWVEA